MSVCIILQCASLDTYVFEIYPLDNGRHSHAQFFPFNFCMVLHHIYLILQFFFSQITACTPEHNAKTSSKIITQQNKYSYVELYKVFPIMVQSCNYLFQTQHCWERHIVQKSCEIFILDIKRGPLMEYFLKRRMKKRNLTQIRWLWGLRLHHSKCCVPLYINPLNISNQYSNWLCGGEQIYN